MRSIPQPPRQKWCASSVKMNTTQMNGMKQLHFCWNAKLLFPSGLPTTKVASSRTTSLNTGQTWMEQKQVPNGPQVVWSSCFPTYAEMRRPSVEESFPIQTDQLWDSVSIGPFHWNTLHSIVFGPLVEHCMVFWSSGPCHGCVFILRPTHPRNISALPSMSSQRAPGCSMPSPLSNSPNTSQYNKIQSSILKHNQYVHNLENSNAWVRGPKERKNPRTTSQGYATMWSIFTVDATKSTKPTAARQKLGHEMEMLTHTVLHTSCKQGSSPFVLRIVCRITLSNDTLNCHQ